MDVYIPTVLRKTSYTSILLTLESQLGGTIFQKQLLSVKQGISPSSDHALAIQGPETEALCSPLTATLAHVLHAGSNTDTVSGYTNYLINLMLKL